MPVTKHEVQWRDIVAGLLQVTGVTGGMGLMMNSHLRGGLVRAVNYHATAEADRESLRSHIRYYQRGFANVGPADLKAFVAGGMSLERPGLMITFDDGFRNNYAVAAELLDEVGMKGFFFVPSGFIECAGNRAAARQFVDGQLLEPWRESDFMPMSWDETRDLVRRGHGLGCHTMSHQALGRGQKPETLYQEIVEAKVAIEHAVGTAIEAFCWPFGSLSSYSKVAFDLVRQHYKYGFTTFGAPLRVGDSLYAIDRSPVEASAGLSRVRCAVEGITELWLARRRRRFEALVRAE